MIVQDEIVNALQKLMQKYKIKSHPRYNLFPGWHFFKKELKEKDVPLLSWRLNRKFTELKNIILGHIVEHVSMLRFASMGSKEEWSIEALMYREFDLCEFLTNSKIASLHATFSNSSAGSVIVKLENGIIGSVEIGVQAPVEKYLIDRHEIIARRGVASDIVVDTQIPQSSIYTYTEKEESSFKDVDFELFGLSELQIEWVRSAFEFYKKPTQLKKFIKQHNHLSRLVNAAIKSNSEKLKIEII